MNSLFIHKVLLRDEPEWGLRPHASAEEMIPRPR